MDNVSQISKPQIKMLWVCAKQFNLDSDALHKVVMRVTGKSSIKSLTRKEAKELINIFVEYGAEIDKKLRKNLPPNVVELATRNQLNYIAYLEDQLGWKENPKRLAGFTERIIKKRRVRTKKEAIKIIQGLKALNKRMIGEDKTNGKAN